MGIRLRSLDFEPGLLVQQPEVRQVRARIPVFEIEALRLVIPLDAARNSTSNQDLDSRDPALGRSTIHCINRRTHGPTA